MAPLARRDARGVTFSPSCGWLSSSTAIPRIGFSHLVQPVVSLDAEPDACGEPQLLLEPKRDF
jgi:hypothetical protein